jgi:gliding motility-associated protein GldM
MIGMMYLVLTAMLALNVSKEAVEAFKKVDKGLTQTIANYSVKNNLIYQEFDRAAAENPAKAGKYKNTAYQIKERADEAYNFIQGLKIEIINKAEGPENLAVKGDEVEIEEVKRIDDTNIPSEILIGANENGKANDLKAMLAEYRDFLIAALEGKNPTAEAALQSSLKTEDGKNKDGEVEHWANLTFQTLPLVAVICILSEYQVAVRNAETEVLNHLYSQIDASSFKFNKLDAIVIPNSNYVELGNEYEAKVFIAARDSTLAPKILVNGSELPLDETGKGIYKVKASSIGSKPWGGIIALQAPDGSTKNYPFKSEYVVGEPNVIVSATAMNVMYYGIPNPIDVSVPGVSPNNISVKVVNGVSTTEKVKNSRGENFKGSWAVKPNAVGQPVQVIVSANINGRTVTYPPMPFRVKSVPPPTAQFAQRSSGKIAKASAQVQQVVLAVLPDFDFDLQYKIQAFTIMFSDKGADYQESSSSSSLTPKQKEIINRIPRGRDFYFKDIRALGPDGRTIDLLPMVFTMD